LLSSSGNPCEEEPFERYFFLSIMRMDSAVVKFYGTEV
jgi:hypothetical protein